MPLLVSMERKKKIALILLSLVLVIFVLFPLLGHFYCKEPNQGFAVFLLEKINGRKSQQVCPTELRTLLYVLKNVFLAVSGLIAGYNVGKPKNEQKNEVSRIQSCRSLNVGRWDASDEFLEIDLHESQIRKRDIF